MPTTRNPLLACLWLAAALLAGAARGAEPIISEVMASNSTTLADEDGAFPDWIEIYNPDSAAVSLNGWYLTDNVAIKTKWQFPAVTIPGGGYLVVFASSKNRRDPAARLHTNFSLDADGDYLALVKSNGTTVVSEFAPKFPKQQENVSFGYPLRATTGNPGYLSKPTPGQVNSELSPIGIAEVPVFSQAAGPFRSAFNLTLSGASIISSKSAMSGSRRHTCATCSRRSRATR